MDKIGDPGYRYHATMSQLWGTVALRLANANVLPFDFAMYAKKLREFVHEVRKKPGAREHVRLDELLREIDSFEQSGNALNAIVATRVSSMSDDQLARTNQDIIAVERNWLHPEGIPGRPWFKHTLYAARYTYAHLELPGLTEAVEKKDWLTAQQQADILSRATSKNAALLAKAAADLRSTTPSDKAGK
jgi:N-acetylated-alpha-linked acidic dipeptidase